MYQAHANDLVMMLLVRRPQYSNSDDSQIMPNTLHESVYNSLLRDRQVCYLDGFPTFSYYLFYILERES